MMKHLLSATCARLRSFLRSNRGNVAMMFGIALVPMTIAAGVGLDYARSALLKSQMSDALDAAALAVGSTKGLNHDTAQSLALQYFNANYKGEGTPSISVGDNDYNSNGSFKVTATYNLPTTLLKVIGRDAVAVTTSTTVVWGQTKLWIALVLDNSGSMCQPLGQPCDNTTDTRTKIYQLKDATNTMLTQLQSVAANPGDVQVGIVPFNREVAVATSNSSASWIDWTFWEQPGRASNTTNVTDSYAISAVNAVGSKAPSTITFSAWGPGDDCPFTTSSNRLMSPFGYYCMPDPSNQATSNRVTSIPSSSTYKGYICPSLDSGSYNTDRNDRWYNGCWKSVKDGTNTVVVDKGSYAACTGFSSSNCTCSGNSSSSSRVCSTQAWVHTWVPNAHSTWGGCITDRTADYDITNGSVSASFPADNPYSSPKIPISSTACMNGVVTPLEYDWTDLTNKVKAMQAGGSTNQAIGVAHGWQMLTPGAPYGAPAVPKNTTRYIILLSDGLNTQNRWWGDGSTEGTSDDDKIDARMKKVCDAAKADGVVIYSLYVHTNGGGNSDPLSNCASDSKKFYDLTSSDQIATAFADITQQITAVRISQ